MKSLKSRFLLGALAFQLVSYSQTQSERETEDSHAQQLLTKARIGMSRGDYGSAIKLLEQALQLGSTNPMQLFIDQDFQPLVDHPDHRRRVRTLVKQHATESAAKMVRDNEPGLRIFVQGQILGERDGTPIPNASVELVHTDEKGRYFEEASPWNPRIFAYLRTNTNGKFSVETIMPGRYRDDSGDLSYSHIHFAVQATGFRHYNSEFAFEDDPILRKQGNPDSVPIALLQDHSGERQYHVVIRLSRD